MRRKQRFTPGGRPRLAQTNRDGWYNIVTGLGIAGKDKSLASKIDWYRLDRETQESLFAADDIAGKICKIIPFDGTREGITWVIDPDEDEDVEQKGEIVKFLDEEFERLHVWQNVFQAWSMARCHGGSLILMVVDDGKDLSEPLDLNAIRKLDNLVVLERWDLTVSSGDLTRDLSDPNFSLPEYYRWTPGTITATEEGSQIIHYSRVLRFDGEPLTRRLYIRNNYWMDSIFTKLQRAITKYTTALESVGNIMQDFNQPVFKIQGLTEAVAQDESELVVSKLEFVNQMRSTQRALVLDAEDEFDHKQSAVSGINDLITKLQERLTAASDIPHTRLLGESPGASLGETGRSELIDYYDTVSARQEIKLRGPINKLTEVLFSQIEANVAEPENWTFTFDPLYQQDQEGIIRTRQIQANIDAIYMREGVYDSFEVAKSRFGSGEYSYETVLDPEKQEEKEEEAEAMKELMKENMQGGQNEGNEFGSNPNNQAQGASANQAQEETGNEGDDSEKDAGTDT